MGVKLIDDSSYELICSWWKERDLTILPKDFLTKYGFISGEIAAAWLFPILGCNTAMVRYPITDPKSSKEERDSALNLLFYTIKETAKDMGYTKIFITTNSRSLCKRLEKYNFTKTEENCFHYWGGL